MEKRILIVLAMVLGLLMVGEARADGAWVLWERDGRLSPAGWDIVNAYSSRLECIQKELFLCTEGAHSYRVRCIQDERGSYFYPYLFAHPRDGSTRIEYRCLPESVDPRK